MKSNKNSYFLTGDLGYNAVEKIEKDFGSRFINVGLAEQNMIGIASGLALSGKKVFVYSIIPFLLMRCFEQIRNDICYHDLDVTLFGVEAGFSYGILSSTHFALEDMAILRPLPNMSIFSPADEMEARLGMRYFKNYHHPLYLRVGKREEPTIYKKPYNFEFGKGVVLREGKGDVVIFFTGSIADEVLKASDLLSKINELATVINIHTVKPIDVDLILKKVKNKKIAFVVEEHGKIGGLGSSIAEVVSEYASSVKVVRIGTDDKVIKIVGNRSYLRKVLGFDTKGIFNKIKQHMAKS